MKKILIVIILICCCVLGVAGCKSGEQSVKIKPEAETFYTLKEAYNNGWLSESDLAAIAAYNNNANTYPETLSESVQNEIKETTAEILVGEINGVIKVGAKDIEITKYYGTYNGLAIVSVKCKLFSYSGQDRAKDLEIGGVKFHYVNSGYVKEMCAWKV